MSKIQQVRDALQSGPHSFARLREITGIAPNVLSVYLAGLEKKGECSKTGVRRSYQYSAAAAGSSRKAEEVKPASDYDAWSEGGANPEPVEGAAEGGAGASVGEAQG